MKKANVGNILMFQGKLVKVVSTMTGKVIHMKSIEDSSVEDFYFLEDSPLFQKEAVPVETLTN